MGIRDNIKRFMSVTLSILVGTGILVLLIAAINKKNSKTCSGFRVEIKAAAGMQFVDEKEVINLLTGDGFDKIIGKTIASFDLRKKEEMIEKNVWIRKARVFFDNNEILRINILVRTPIARVFTAGGESYYIDSAGVLLPLQDKLPAKVPVFTDFPHQKWSLHGSDSVLSRQVINLSTFISKDPFWMSQIEQIRIKADKTFEMVPEVGGHLIGFGEGVDIEKKFHRLFIFYQEVMIKTGFEKYNRIDLRYSDQVVATRRGGNIGKIDSLKAVKNVEQLIRSAQQMPIDDIHLQNTLPLEHNSITERTLTNYDLIPNADESLSDTSASSLERHYKTTKKQNKQPKIKIN